MRGVSADRTRTDRHLRRLDAGLLLFIGGLSLVSLLTWLTPGFPGLPDAGALDIAIDVAATLVGAAVGILAWIRWRETGQPVALYESSAFVGLTVVSALMLGLIVSDQAIDFGLAPDAPGDAPVYLWTLTRLVAAILLVIGAVRGLRRWRPPLPALTTALVPALVLVGVALVLFGREAVLPPVPGVGAFDPGGPSPQAVGIIATAVAFLQVVIFELLIVAAILFRRLYLRDRLVSHAFLAAGLVLAAFSQLHFGLSPVVLSGVVTTADALNLGFYAVLFMGIQAELESDLVALRRANADLRRLGEVEAANAALAERTRLAREIHDGLAQDLWYAKLKQGRLTQEAGLDESAKATAGEVLSAIDSALAEARQAVMTMRATGVPGRTLAEAMRAYVDDFADRFGVPTEFNLAGELPKLSPRTEAELLRIVQEALNNVRRHADATLVRVTVEGRKSGVTVAVTDNGRGFEPGAVARDRFGLRGMRERADTLGAALTIDSRPADGTRITLDVPATEAVA
jgi:signal transduction histidine kinase